MIEAYVPRARGQRGGQGARQAGAEGRCTPSGSILPLTVTLSGGTFWMRQLLAAASFPWSVCIPSLSPRFDELIPVLGAARTARNASEEESREEGSGREGWEGGRNKQEGSVRSEEESRERERERDQSDDPREGSDDEARQETAPCADAINRKKGNWPSVWRKPKCYNQSCPRGRWNVDQTERRARWIREAALAQQAEGGCRGCRV